jgi:biofilm protein TabA
MLYGHLDCTDTYQHLLAHPVWKTAFDWLRTMPPDVRPQIYPIEGERMFVNVHGYDPLPRNQCRYESHRRHLDLQYCIRGGELIDWHLARTLSPDGEYDEPKDVQFYKPGDSMTTVHMEPGSFVIFHPSDGHRPKVADEVNGSVFKLVIKIEIGLLSPPA